MYNDIIDVENLLEMLSPLEEVPSMALLPMISRFNENSRKEILNNNIIKNKLRHDIFLDNVNNYWELFRNVLNYLSSKELLSLIDKDFLDNYYKDKRKPYKNILYAALCEKDLNETIEYALENEEFFNDLFIESEHFYSKFYKLNYELLKEVILRMEKMNFPFKLTFFSILNKEDEESILHEDLKSESLIKLVKASQKEVKQNFFMNDKRAKYLYNYFDIASYILNGIKISNDILKSNGFFEKIKVNSFIDYRSIINKLEANNDIETVWKNLNNYYDELINDFDGNLFKEYNKLITNPDNLYIRNYSYILSEDIIYDLHNILAKSHYNIEEYKKLSEDYLKNATSLKLSEIITDALFKDNYYNVKLNIKEMLRYNEKIKDKVISGKWKDFYNTILNFDNLNNKEKIKIFDSFRDTKIDEKYYEDMRKLKDICYRNINNDLFNTIESGEYINNDLTNKYNVRVFDMRDKEYTMLIRAQKAFKETWNSKRSCYSIISNDNNNSFGDANIMIHYGYNSFDIDKVLHILEKDSYSYDAKDGSPSNYVNRLMSSDEIVKNSAWYSEFELVNDKNDDGSFKMKKPDYIVAYNSIDDKDLNEAKRLNIPIVLIKSKLLDKNNTYSIPFDSNYDMYIDESLYEKNFRGTR